MIYKFIYNDCKGSEIMDWIKQLNETMEYIEENLDGEISYKRISKIAGCSIYNFQRMFSYIANKPLAEYIRSRRLTSAAFDLLNSSEKIIDVSIKYGYKSQDSFSRAFRNFHGVLPSTVRSEIVQLKSCPKLSFQISIKGEYFMNYQIEEFPAFKVCGMANKVKVSKAFELIPKIWSNAWQDGTVNELLTLFQKTDYRPAGLLGISAGGHSGKSEIMNYILGITNHVDVSDCKYVSPLEGMEEYTYPAATWAVFEANGELPDAVQKVYKHFYSEWLPNSGYQLADLPVFECYMQDNRQEVWIAVLKDNDEGR